MLSSHLPIFPAFKPLELEDRLQLIPFLSKFEPYSDFNFTSLYCWSGPGESEISCLNENLVMRMPDYMDGHKIYSILGDNEIDESLLELLAHTDKLNLVPQVVVDCIRKEEDFLLAENPDNHDYIYELEQLGTLTGQPYKKLRNKTNKFLVDHEGHKVEIIITSAIDPELAQIIKDIDHLWSVEFTRESGDIRSEKQALYKLLENANRFNLFIVTLKINDVMKAFSINELLSDNYAICHFEKALKSHHNYIATFLVHEVAKCLMKHGAKLVNWEQNLGLEGLRKSKESYRPVKYLKKYDVALSRNTLVN